MLVWLYIKENRKSSLQKVVELLQFSAGVSLAAAAAKKHTTKGQLQQQSFNLCEFVSCISSGQ